MKEVKVGQIYRDMDRRHNLNHRFVRIMAIDYVTRTEWICRMLRTYTIEVARVASRTQRTVRWMETLRFIRTDRLLDRRYYRLNSEAEGGIE